MPTIEKRTTTCGNVTYRAKVRVKGYPPQQATFDRKTDADRWAQRTEADLRDDKYFPSVKAKKYTVADLIDAHLKNLKTTNPRRHSEVEPLLAWWKSEVGFIMLSHFKSAAVLEGQQKLMRRERQRKDAQGNTCQLSPATVNRYLVALHTAVKFGVHPLGWISTNPVHGINKLKEAAGRTRFLSDDEVKRLLKACRASKNPHLFAVVLIGISTGARRSEIQCIKWSDINNDGTLATLPKTKNGKIRALPLQGVVAEIVKKMRDGKSEADIYLFPSPNNPNRPIVAIASSETSSCLCTS